MSDLMINSKDNFIELDVIQSRLYPDKKGIGIKKRLGFLFTGEVKGKINSIFIRLKNKELHFLSRILKDYERLKNLENKMTFERDEEKIFCICGKNFLSKKNNKKIKCPYCKSEYIENKSGKGFGKD